MFRSSTKLPQRKIFSWTPEELIEDIKNITNNEEQRKKLYMCIDDKPPYQPEFYKIEHFVKGTDDLENAAEVLNDLCDQLHISEKELVSGSSRINDHISDLLKKINL